MKRARCPYCGAKLDENGICQPRKKRWQRIIDKILR